MKLVDLNPRWVGAGGEGVYNADGTPAAPRSGVGISFDCPCPTCTAKRTGDADHDWYLRVFVGFANPLDGGPAHDPRPGQQWTRTGDTFETLQLSPSIRRHRVGDGGCDWHGFVGSAGAAAGEVITC
jgi:hypothetical protein